MVPNRPELPPGSDLRQVFAVGSRTRKNVVNWFVCKNEADMM